MPADQMTISRTYREDAFWNGDCALESGVMNAVAYPVPGLLALLSARPSNVEEIKYSAIVSRDVAPASGTRTVNPCDDAPTIPDAYDACKIGYTFGRITVESSTIDPDELTDNACIPDKFYDYFFVPTNNNGIPNNWTRGFGELDFTQLLSYAVFRQARQMTGNIALWMQDRLWNGDPLTYTRPTGGDGDFWGLNSLITDTWSTNANLPIEHTGAQSTCAPLNSTVVDFGNNCLGDGVGNIYRTLNSVMAQVDFKATRDRNRFDGVVVMGPNTWQEFHQYWHSKKALWGAPAGVQNVTDGLNGMQNAQAIEQLRQNPQIMLNGRMFPVVIDDGITETNDNGRITSSIKFVPLTVNGEEATWIEYKDYQYSANGNLRSRFEPIANNYLTDGRAGWTDDGKFRSLLKFLNECFVMRTKTKPRLIFRAPQYAWTVNNVDSCPDQVLAGPDVTYSDPA